MLAQLKGSGSRADVGSYNVDASALLTRFLAEVPLKDGDSWIQELMKENSALAFRVLDVRAAYAAENFGKGLLLPWPCCALLPQAQPPVAACWLWGDRLSLPCRRKDCASGG